MHKIEIIHLGIFFSFLIFIIFIMLLRNEKVFIYASGLVRVLTDKRYAWVMRRHHM